jgi:adenosylmethionine-8-amino-7-oxononanoate aminotransferase
MAICPPLIITEAQIDALLERFGQALEETASWVEHEGLASVA